MTAYLIQLKTKESRIFIKTNYGVTVRWQTVNIGLFIASLYQPESSETLKDIIVAQPIKTPGDSGLQHLLSTVEISLWDTTFAIKKLKLRILKIDSDLKL